MPVKRPHGQSSSLNGDGNEGNSQSKRPLSKKPFIKKPKSPPPARQKTAVKKLAAEESGIQILTAETEIMARIKKCLDRANHPTTPEAEANAALKVASRLMGQYNVTQADLLATSQEADFVKYTGESIVSVKNTREQSKTVVKHKFVDGVAGAMEKFFDCKSFVTSRQTSVEWTFYGIAPNTVAAAMAFEMVFNLILEWARPKKGGSETYSYCMGVACGLERMAEREKQKELERARRQEEETIQAREREERAQRERKLGTFGAAPTTFDDTSRDLPHVVEIADVELDTSAASPLRSTESANQEVYKDLASALDSESEVGEISNTPDGLDVDSDDDWNVFDDEWNASDEEEKDTEYDGNELELESTENQALWKNGMQLVRYRKSAQKMADDYLKSQDLKVSRRTSKVAPIRDQIAYSQGKTDSKKIDVQQRRIKDKE